jgi:hypothetical protein
LAASSFPRGASLRNRAWIRAEREGYRIRHDQLPFVLPPKPFNDLLFIRSPDDSAISNTRPNWILRALAPISQKNWNGFLRRFPPLIGRLRQLGSHADGREDENRRLQAGLASLLEARRENEETFSVRHRDE